MEDEIMRKFLSVNKQSNSPRIGKYASKKETFYEDIEKASTFSPKQRNVWLESKYLHQLL